MLKTNKEKALSADALSEDKTKIEEYLDQLKLDEPVALKDFLKVVGELIAERGRYIYFMWKVLQENSLDADKLIQEACYRWGAYNGKQMKDIDSPADFLKALSSKAGILAWEQEFTMMNNKRASKVFNSCPLVTAFEGMDVPKEEIVKLCKDFLCYGDYGMADQHPIKLEWAEPTLGEEGECCVMMVTRREDKGKKDLEPAEKRR